MKRRLFTFVLLLFASSMVLQVGAQSDFEDEIEALIADMQEAVLAQDAELYLSYVDLSDVVFAREHSNWAYEWAEEDFVTDFELSISNLELAEDDDQLAIADLRLRWEATLPEQTGLTARYTVQFTYNADDERWLYAGEYWVSTLTDNFVVHAPLGFEVQVDDLLPILPEVYDSVTTAYEYIPQNPMEIKIYADSQSLGATTLLSLPLIGGWNEPGESLKIVGGNPMYMPSIVAHEFTHFLTFDQAGTANPMMPWWLNEGISEYFSRSFAPDYDPDALDARVMAIQGLEADGGLVAWEMISVFEETPVDLWGYVYPQGYTFAVYMSETFGREARNDWLHLMVDMSIDEATEAVFAKSFDDLNTSFLLWLAGYPVD